MSSFIKDYELIGLQIKDIKIRSFMDKVKFIDEGKEIHVVYKDKIFHKLYDQNDNNINQRPTNRTLYNIFKKCDIKKLSSIKKNKTGVEVKELSNSEKAKKIMELYGNDGYYND
jgi:hypothetical protein